MGCCSSHPSKVVVPFHQLDRNTINPQRSVISQFVQTNDNLPSLENQNGIVNLNSDQRVVKPIRNQFEIQKINLNPLTFQKNLLENKVIQGDLEQQQQRISKTIQEAKQQNIVQQYKNNQHKPDVQLQINNLQQVQFKKKVILTDILSQHKPDVQLQINNLQQVQFKKKVIKTDILSQTREIKNEQQLINKQNQIKNESTNNQEKIAIFQVDQFHTFKEDQSKSNIKLQTISLQFRQNIINLQRSQGEALFIKLKKIEFQDKKKSYQKRKQLVDNLEIEIINQRLDLNKLMSFAEQNNIELFDLLISYNQNKQSILELIILYIDNYQIIQYFLLNYEFSLNIFLHEIGNALFNKIKPFLKDSQKIKMTIDFIFQVRKSNEIAKIMWQIDFKNLLSYLNLNNEQHLKLLKLIGIILSKNQIDQSFIILYQESKKSYRFQNLKIPKSLAKGKSDVKISDQLLLPELSFNIFHQVALEQKWDVFIQCNNAYYYKSNISQKTPFMLMFQLAPLRMINEYLKKYESSLSEGINYSQDNGYNLLHCLCRNKYIHSNQSEIQILFANLQKYPQTLKNLQLQPYHDQIPLIYYLDFQKKPEKIIIEFLASCLKEEINQPIIQILKFFLNTQIQNHSVKEIQQKQKLNLFKQGKQKQQTLNIREKFFIYKVQLAKQIIKHSFVIKISHITDIQLFISNLFYWSCFPTFTIAHNFIAIDQEQVKMKCLKLFFKTQQQLQLDINYYYKNLLILKQCAEKEIQQLLAQEISLIVQKNPQLNQTQEIQNQKMTRINKIYTKNNYLTSFFYKEKKQVSQNILLVEQNEIILHTQLQNITLDQCTKLYDCQYYQILGQRYDYSFEFLKIENLNLIPQNYKQKVVIHQIKNKLTFIECILLFSECQQDFQKIEQEEFSNQILKRRYLFKHIKTISQNDSLANVIYFLQMEKFKDQRNIFDFLIELTNQYFDPFAKKVYKQEDQKDFNVQLKKICSKLSQFYGFTLPSNYTSKETLYQRLLFDNLDQESFYILVSFDCKVFSTKLQKQSKLQIAMLDKLFTTSQNEEQKLGFDEKFLTLEATKYYFDKIISNFNLWHQLPFNLNGRLSYQLNQIFDTDPKKVIDYYIIFNSKIKETEFPLRLYSKALKQGNQINLLRILKNLKIQKIKNFFIQTVHNQQQFENYVLALKFPPCLVLNLEQFIKFLEIDKTDQQQLQEYLQLCLKSGLYEKVELILKKLGAFRSLQQKEIILEQITNIMLLDKQSKSLSKLLILHQQPEQKYCDLQNYFFFLNSVEPYTYQRKQEQQKKSDRQLLDIAIQNIDKKQLRCVSQKDIAYKLNQEKKEFLRLLFQQASQYGKQNQIITCQFQPKVVNQKLDFQQCYKCLRNWIGNQNVSEIGQNFELIYSLIQPENQKLTNKIDLVRVLASSLEKKILTVKNFHKEKLKGYLALIKLNCEKNFKTYFSQDFSLQNLDLNTCLMFIDELIIDKLIYTPSSNELEYIVFYLKIQNKSLIAILKSNFLGCQMFYYKSLRLKFTSASLFYLKNGVNLLPNQKYNFYEMRKEKEVKKAEKKIKVLSNHISDQGLNLNILTPCQVYILFRAENHILQKPNFDQSFVLLAFLSGSIETLEYVLNLSDNPSKLVNEQKIFQLLIIYRFNETAILNFYQKFVRNHPSNHSDLIFQRYPLLYYIIQQKFEQVFFQCYLPLIKTIFGENAQATINEQLSFQIFENFNVLQLALQKKCYFILNYCQDIISSQQIMETKIYFDIEILQIQKKQNDLRQKFLQLYSNNFKLNKLQINELIQFEKACLCSIFKCDFEFQLKNHQLSIKLKQNKWKELKILKSNPNLLAFTIESYKQDKGDFDIKDELYEEILKNCFNQTLTHPIYLELAQLKMKKFFANIIEQQPFLLTLPLTIQSFYSLKSKDLDFFILEISKIKFNDLQTFMLEIIFPGFLLYSIHTDDYSLTKRNFNISTLSKIHQQLLNQDLINQQTKKPYFTVSSEKYLLSYLKPNIIFQDLDILKNILEDQLSKERAIVTGILHIIKINKIVESVLEKINQSGINFQYEKQLDQKFIIFIGQGFATYRKDEIGQNEFTLPIEYSKDSLFIQEECIKQIIELLKIELFNLNIDEELNNFQKIAEDFKDYDLSSITTIMQQEYIAQSQTQTGLYEKCFFFRHLCEEQFTESGIYKIYDQSAPHYQRNLVQIQNENMKPIVQNLQESIYEPNKNNQKPNIQRQQSLINKQQKMKEDFQFMLELLPDNTYQVRQSKFTNNQKKLIFTEFYNFQQPYIIVNLEQLSQQEFQAKYNIQTLVTYIISDLYQYNQYLSCLLEEKEPFQWTIKFPFYVNEQKFHYQKELFSTNQIQCIQSRMLEFIENLFLIVERKNLSSQFEWRINLISFFEVFILKLSALKQNASNSVQHLIEQILNWDTFIIILQQILFNTIINEQQLLKVIRCVYVEFNESIEKLNQNQSPSGLDEIFQFHKTNYLLYNNILIVRFNVAICSQNEIKEILQKEKKNASKSMNPNQENENLIPIVNRFDFYSQIFNHEQLVFYFFNKFEIDLLLLSYSKKMSQMLKKEIIISIDNSSLAEIFGDEILNLASLKNDFERQKKLSDVKFILSKLYAFFEEELFGHLENQFKSQIVLKSFQACILSLNKAIKNQIPFNEIVEQNNFMLEATQSIPLLNDQVFLKCNQMCMFGFQISNEYYLSISQLGDLLIKFEMYNEVKYYQLVYKFTPTQFLFYQLQPLKAELSMEEIFQNQNKYLLRKFEKNKYVEIQAPLNAIILLKQKWPEDEKFNSQIKNLFYVDQISCLHYVSGNVVPKKMKELLLEQNEEQKQKQFKQYFCLENIEDGITIEKILNLLPNEINFRFSSNNQLKKQKQVVSLQQHCISIKIFEDKFKIDPLPIKSVSTACYFQSHPKYQSKLKTFSDFIKIKKELPQIQIIFDDQLNQFPLLACDIILNSYTIFEEFQKGYQLFLEESYEPILENSLQILFGKQSILQLKKEFIAKAIKKIDFIFLLSQDKNPEQIIYQDQKLSLYTIFNEQGKLNFSSFQTIALQLNQIILDFEKFQLSEIITDKNFSLKLTNNITNENRGIICELILISRYFFQIHSMIWPQQKLIISILSTKELQVPLIGYFYQFYQNDQLFIAYDKFEDFDLSNFFLDCLNKKSHFKADRYYKKLIYTGPQIILENFSLYPINYLQGQKNLKKIEVIVFDAQFGELKNCKELDPKSFHKVYLIFKEDETFIQFQAVISLKCPFIQGYITQLSIENQLNQSCYLLINDLKSEIPSKSQLYYIKWQDDNYNKFELSNLDESLSKQSDIFVNQQFITNNLLLIEINSKKVVKIKIYSKTENLSFKLDSFTNKIEFQFFSNLEQDLTKTIHYSTILNGEEQFVIGGSSNKPNNSYYNDFSIRSILKNGEDENTIFFDQTDLASRAGQERIDSIQFRDNERNKILNYKYQKAVFVHKNNRNIQYIPKEIKEEQVLKLVWNPIIKGSYDLFIDDVNIAGAFLVLADVICVQFCEVQLSQLFLQEVKKFQDLPFGYILRDKYKNEYEDVDYKEKIEYDFQIDQQDILLVHNIKSEKIGKINGKMHFEVPKDSDQGKKSFRIDFIIGGQIIKSQNIVLTGLSLEKRKEYLSEELGKIREKFFFYKYQEFKRINFFSELQELVKTKLNDKFEIKFKDELGSDCGGLRREFYDMIGKILKDQQYSFFSPIMQNQSQYFLNKKFNRIRNKEEYALLFGKLIANSIVNKEIIGIDIIAPFWKVIFDEKIVAEDLNFILDASTFKNYLDMRKQDYDFDIVCANFTIQVGNNEIELIPNGKNIDVTKNNVEDYLQKTAEYLIHLQFKEIYLKFKEGFNSLLDSKILKKWLLPQEVSLLTNGLSEITAEIIFKKVRYIGGTPIHKSYFENFCSQADNELLRKMLKFITGSPNIPYEQSDYKIEVLFTTKPKNPQNPELPISHTCFNRIDVPLYESFGQFRQKLEIAILNCQEGFGMA